MSIRAQILLVLITTGTLWFILSLVRRRTLRSKYALLWVAVGFLLVAFAIVPGVLVPISEAAGIEYEPATFFLAAIAFLFVIVVHFSWELSRLEDRTRSLAEEVALLRAALPSPDAGEGVEPGTQPDSTPSNPTDGAPPA
ncbi:hypothetical protein B7486_54675 [cyanobacterium TDX16]|nr:hypothetical protein B7486_54675 [cyanobacterium TDX16]